MATVVRGENRSGAMTLFYRAVRTGAVDRYAQASAVLARRRCSGNHWAKAVTGICNYNGTGGGHRFTAESFDLVDHRVSLSLIHVLLACIGNTVTTNDRGSFRADSDNGNTDTRR